jgi:hypothetical protein
VDPYENSAEFIPTSFLSTSQNRGDCEGISEADGLCSCGEGNSLAQCCVAGSFVLNGRKTGKCSSNGKYCQIQGWCPQEVRGICACLICVGRKSSSLGSFRKHWELDSFCSSQYSSSRVSVLQVKY